MRTFADFATWMFPDLNWLSMKEGLDEFAALMKSQLDLSVEAKNLSKFRENFSKQPEVVFPRPFLGKQEGTYTVILIYTPTSNQNPDMNKRS